jgi:hypothetical protein
MNCRRGGNRVRVAPRENGMNNPALLKSGMELLPGTYTFKYNDGTEKKFTISADTTNNVYQWLPGLALDASTYNSVGCAADSSAVDAL